MDFHSYLTVISAAILELGRYQFLMGLFVIVLLIELPYYLIIVLTILRQYLLTSFSRYPDYSLYHPTISCIIPCYSEGAGVILSIRSLVEQIYSGNIEILVIVDGSKQNQHTYDAALAIAKSYVNIPNREIRVIPKYIRGGKVSSLNLGLQLAKGEIIMVLDGETSCDNTSLQIAAQIFIEQSIVALSGAVRVRNARKNLVTNLQNLEYLLGINLARQGLSELNSLNIISGAFGFFRKTMLKQMGGWRTGSGEDLDLTIRIQSMFSRYRKLRLLHSSRLVSHTDAPESWRVLFRQRLRWDGDMFYVWLKRYRGRLTSSFMRFTTSFLLMWGGLLFNLVVPLSILVYIPYILFNFQLNFVLTLLLFTYLYYLLITILNFVVFITMVSERKRKDCLTIPYLFLMPVYQFIMRIWTAIAIIYEITLNSHRYSSMAPWWVLKNRE